MYDISWLKGQRPPARASNVVTQSGRQKCIACTRYISAGCARKDSGFGLQRDLYRLAGRVRAAGDTPYVSHESGFDIRSAAKNSRAITLAIMDEYPDLVAHT